MPPPVSDPPLDNGSDEESPGTKRWAYLTALRSLGWYERRRQKLAEDVKRGKIPPLEAMRTEKHLRVREEIARNNIEMSGFTEEPVEDGPSETDSTEVSARNVFGRTQQGWEVVYNGHRERLNDTKGIRAIGYLLSLPDGIPVWGAGEVRDAMDGGDPQASALRKSQGTGQEATDKQTITIARRRVSDISEELETDLSVERREELVDERDQIMDYLDGSVGLGGRARTFGGRNDGQAVGKAVTRALARIKIAHAQLHTHLKDAIKNYYSDDIRYEPSEATTWDVTIRL